MKLREEFCMRFQLKPTDAGRLMKGPLLTIIMDGVGIGPDYPGNAVLSAHMPTLRRLMATYPTLHLRASGTAVGLPGDDDMGNSEVGHNAIGAGQVFAQGAKLVSQSIASGKMFASGTWKDLVAQTRYGGTMHFIGLFSDGNVHSHIDHLKAMIERAKKDGVKTVRIHVLLDGRDVGETSALDYILPFEKFLAEINDDSFDARIASGGGRMKITMDRYGADWKMVENGWKTHVRGEGRTFSSAEEAVRILREETHAIDQDLPPFIIASGGEPIGRIADGDAVIFFNFRGDRSIEISTAFEADSFDKFDRTPRPKVLFAGMLEYDGDTHIPSRYLVSPPEIVNTMGEAFANTGLRQLALSETQKFGHVTYFWNGNKSGKFNESLEDYVEIRSDTVPFEQRPWMKCAEITDVLIDALLSRKYDFIRVNYPNGDMVGHTGSFDATRVGLESLDLQLSRVIPVLDRVGGAALITADHGNSDEMFEFDKKTGKIKTNPDGTPKAKTSHTLNPVPLILYHNDPSPRYTVKKGVFGLSDIAAISALFLGFRPAEVWDEPVISLK